MDEEIQQFILANIANHPQDIVKLTMNHFSKSRPGVIYHLDQLLEQGLIKKRGIKNKTVYTDEQNQTLYFESESTLEDFINNTDLKKYNLKVYHLLIKNFIPKDLTWSCEIKKNQKKINVKLWSQDGTLDATKVLEEIKKFPVINIGLEFDKIKIQKSGVELAVGASNIEEGIVVSWDLLEDEKLSLSFVEHMDTVQLKINVEKYLGHDDGALKLKELLKDKKEVMFNFHGVEVLNAKFIEVDFISLISRFPHIQFYIVGLSFALKFFLQLELSKTSLSKNVIWVKEKK